MCDYSLMVVRNRLAIEGEELVAHGFQSGTTGLVSCSDFKIWQAERRSKSIWQRLMNMRWAKSWRRGDAAEPQLS